MLTSLAVFPISSNLFLKAQEVANKLNLPLIPNLDNSGISFILAVTEERLEIRKLTKPKINPIYVEFLNGKNAYRNAIGKGSELIAKAVGIKGNYTPSVLDGTAGFGSDAFVLANLGCKVLMLERSPIVATLLDDGLKRLFSYAQKQKLELALLNVDTKDYIQNIPSNNTKPDVIYLDPMYPTIQKTAMPKIEMRILREIVGNDFDAKDILALALNCAQKRVVVKRPRFSEMLNNFKPDIIFEGASSRFDVYITNFVNA